MSSQSRRSANRFNQREVSRALRAVTETGAVVDRVDIYPASDRISVIVARPGQGETPPPDAAAWDKATEELEGKVKGR